MPVKCQFQLEGVCQVGDLGGYEFRARTRVTRGVQQAGSECGSFSSWCPQLTPLPFMGGRHEGESEQMCQGPFFLLYTRVAFSKVHKCTICAKDSLVKSQTNIESCLNMSHSRILYVSIQKLVQCVQQGLLELMQNCSLRLWFPLG